MVSLAAAMFVWLAAGSARAEAPLCDQRGATVFAPAPQLQDEELVLSVGDAPECATPDETVSLRESKDGRPAAGAASTSLYAMSTSTTIEPMATLLLIVSNRAVDAKPLPGVAFSLDRPPRQLAL